MEVLLGVHASNKNDLHQPTNQPINQSRKRDQHEHIKNGFITKPNEKTKEGSALLWVVGCMNRVRGLYVKICIGRCVCVHGACV